jgi:hypothetical protein
MLWGIARNLTQQDYPRPVELGAPLRPLVLSWSVFCLLIAVGYSSNLVSVLSQSRYSAKIRTVQDLVRQRCPWGYNTYPETAEIYSTEKVS